MNYSILLQIKSIKNYFVFVGRTRDNVTFEEINAKASRQYQLKCTKAVILERCSYMNFILIH